MSDKEVIQLADTIYTVEHEGSKFFIIEGFSDDEPIHREKSKYEEELNLLYEPVASVE